MTEIKLDINIALLMLGLNREFYEERKAWKNDKCIFNKTNVEKIRTCVLSETEKYFGHSLENIIGFDEKNLSRKIKKLLMKPEFDEPLPVVLGKIENRPRPNCKF